MAWVFVLLKLRILLNRIAKSSAIALVGFVLLMAGAVVVAASRRYSLA